jgi:hypothetical protein
MPVRVLFAILLLSVLTACQTVGDARGQFCTSLRAAGQTIVDTVNAIPETKTAQTVGDLRRQIREIRRQVQIARNVAAAVRADAGILAILKALDDTEAAVQNEPDNRLLSEVADRIRPPLTALKTAYDSTLDAVCAAK